MTKRIPAIDDQVCEFFLFACLAALAVSVFAENAPAHPPVFNEGTSTMRSLLETFVALPTQSETFIGDRVAADHNGGSFSYSLAGADADKFTITPSTGQIKTKVGERYDYEADPSFEVTVTAGHGNGSTATIAVTINLINNTDESPGYMPTPTIAATDVTSLLVSWQVPPIEGRPEITGYDLRYRRITSESWTDVPGGVTGTSAEITCLAPDTYYKVQMQAYNEDGASGWSGESNPRRTLTCPPLQTCSPSQTCSSLATVGAQVSAEPEPEPEVRLQARLKDVPAEHDGSTAFALQIAFSEPIETTQEQMQQAFMVTGGTVTSAQKVDGRSTLWEITVTPNGNDDVRIFLPRTTSCSAVGAVCSSSDDGKVLSRGVAVSVARAPLRARFEEVPAGHHRTAAFTLQLAFSEPIDTTAVAIPQALMVTGGKINSVQPVDSRSDLWEIAVTPDSNDDVRISLPPTTSCNDEGAVCTEDGWMLSEGVAVSVARAPLTVRFEGVPAEHNGIAFALQIVFSEPIGLTQPALKQALTVTGGRRIGPRRVGGLSDRWEVVIHPNATDVRIALPSTTSCDAEGAVCTKDGIALQNDAQVVISFLGYLMPHRLAKVSGDNQSGPASTQLAESFVVLASDDDGAAMAGVRVAFTVTSGGGLLSTTTDANPCIFKSSKSSVTTITDANGQATTRLTLGSEPGTNTVEVSVEGLEPETFTATATEQAMPYHLAKGCGDDQEGIAGALLAEPLVVLVSDEEGAAMAGVAVSFTVTAGGGTLSATTDTTDDNGRARTWLTLGSELGTNTVEATVEGLEPVTFTATGQESDLAGLFDALQNGMGKLIALPDSPQLAQNAPNPFNGQTVLSYFLPESGPVRLEVFSVTGQRVAVLQQGLQQAGYHRLRWHGHDDAGRPVASGLYLYRLMTDEGSLTHKLTLLR
ncbi:MAG: fibronectin type III domain-containing protein [Gemmatimonadota bacterium]|nr:fibronectin type III domain-containing protein [Gemmatimonadota bacterium]